MDAFPRRLGGILQELDEMYSPRTLEDRASTSYGVSVKFFQLIESMIDTEEDQKRLMSAWFKSVRDKDFKKFTRALKRYDRVQNGQPMEPEDIPEYETPKI